MHLKKIEQLEKEIKNYTFNADGSVTVEFTNKSVNVKKEDIPEIASKIYEDTVYFLKNKGDADV